MILVFETNLILRGHTIDFKNDVQIKLIEIPKTNLKVPRSVLRTSEGFYLVNVCLNHSKAFNGL